MDRKKAITIDDLASLGRWEKVYVKEDGEKFTELNGDTLKYLQLQTNTDLLLPNLYVDLQKNWTWEGGKKLPLDDLDDQHDASIFILDGEYGEDRVMTVAEIKMKRDAETDFWMNYEIRHVKMRE